MEIRFEKENTDCAKSKRYGKLHSECKTTGSRLRYAGDHIVSSAVIQFLRMPDCPDQDSIISFFTLTGLNMSNCGCQVDWYCACGIGALKSKLKSIGESE